MKSLFRMKEPEPGLGSVPVAPRPPKVDLLMKALAKRPFAGQGYCRTCGQELKPYQIDRQYADSNITAEPPYDPYTGKPVEREKVKFMACESAREDKRPVLTSPYARRRYIQGWCLAVSRGDTDEALGSLPSHDFWWVST